MKRSEITALDAIRWCAKNQAESTWVTINGKPFVVLSCGPYVTENKTLQEAVSYLMTLMEREERKKANDG